MKKILCLLVALMCSASLTACSNAGGNGIFTPENEVLLTPANIEEYLVVRIIEPMRIKVKDSLAGIPLALAGDIAVDIYSKKPVQYDDVTLQFDLVTADQSYPLLKDQTIQLKYDGTASDMYYWNCGADTSLGSNDEEIAWEQIEEFYDKYPQVWEDLVSNQKISLEVKAVIKTVSGKAVVK